MQIPETGTFLDEPSRQYREILNPDNLNEFISGFSTSEFICQERGFAPHFFHHPDYPQDQVMLGYLWAPGFGGGAGKWLEVRVDASNNPNPGMFNIRESFVVSLEVPCAADHPVVNQFLWDMNETWHRWLDKSR